MLYFVLANSDSKAKVDPESLEYKSGFYTANAKSWLYLKIQNLRVADCDKNPPFDLSGIWLDNKKWQLSNLKINSYIIV